jgi:hypothetical protein
MYYDRHFTLPQGYDIDNGNGRKLYAAWGRISFSPLPIGTCIGVDFGPDNEMSREYYEKRGWTIIESC